MRKIVETKDFVLGTFASNCSGGMTVTKLPERWAATWENNEKLGLMLDEAGIDFMLPIARWIGYGGETDFHGTVLETVTWATALLAKTRNITVFATVHVAANQPRLTAPPTNTAPDAGRAGCRASLSPAGPRCLRRVRLKRMRRARSNTPAPA